jgi:hypothetical protein
VILSARVLEAFASVNVFQYARAAQASAGSDFVLTLQLDDASVLLPTDRWYPSGLRYCPPATSLLQVDVVSVDSSYSLTKFATQPSALDASIWQVTFGPADFPNGGTFSLRLRLTEPGPVLKTGFVSQALRVEPASCPPAY